MSAQAATADLIGPIAMNVREEYWAYAEPFTISGYTREGMRVILVTLEAQGCIGRGEAAGVRYLDDTVATIAAQLEAIRPIVECGLNHALIQAILPAGGARNALDCALWDLEAKLRKQSVWQLARLARPHPVISLHTCGVEAPEAMARRAAVAYAHARAIKIKLAGDNDDVGRIAAVRAARPDVTIAVDANQALSLQSLCTMASCLEDAGVAFLEQPLPRGQDECLADLAYAIPLAADESVQSAADLAVVAKRYQIINIKLDKSGGLTHALAMAGAAEALGLDVVVGNMGNTSLAMAPAFLIGQRAIHADLDGPLFLKHDREPGAAFNDGAIFCGDDVWGGP